MSLVGVGLALVMGAFAGEPPHDTVLARYFVTYADTTGYQSITHEDGHRTVTIACPGSGHAILTAEVWPENLAEYRMLKEQVMSNKEQANDLKGSVRELDSLLQAKDRP
jgi:hypothetical protein